MDTKRQHVIRLVAAGLFLATLTLALLPVAVGRARSDALNVAPARYGPVIAPTVHATPAAPRDQPELDPAYTTFVIQYRGQAASPGLVHALADLQTAGRIAAIDVTSAPGRIFVLGDETAILALRETSGVVAITRADAQPAADWPPVPPAPQEGDAAFPPHLTGEISEKEPRHETFYPALDPTPLTPGRDRPAARLPDPQVTSPATVHAGAAHLPGVLFPRDERGDKREQHTAGILSIAANGFITGVVTAADGGAPIAGAGVVAYQYSPYVYQSTNTDASGVYSMSIPPGSYRVSFFPPDYHVSEYYDDVPYNTPGDHTPVVVSDDTVTPNINAGLASGAQIIGHVTDQATASPLAGIEIYVDDPSEGYYYGHSYTDSDGVYTTTPGLPAGSYRVRFADYGGAYATEYYTHVFRPSLATLVSLTSTNHTGIDAALSEAAVITGVVTGTSPLSDISVNAYYAGEYTYADSATTDGAGAYRLVGLAPISYKLQFYDSAGQYLSEWYQDKLDWDTADPITLTSGLTTTINAQLTQGGIISGTVTVEGSGTLLENINVTAYDATSGSYVSSDSTDGSGVYRIGGLAAGSYKLRFRDYSGVYLTEYHEDKPDLDSADPITVTAGVTTTVNAQLTPAGVISGTVTAEDGGAPLSDVSVSAYDAATGSYVSYGSTDASGLYRIGGLEAGNYKLYFYDNNGVYLTEYYEDKPDFDSGDPVAVTAGLTTTVNAQLTQAGIISGTVTAEGSGTLLENISVRAYDATSGSYVSNDDTDGTGVYRIGGLAAGSYKLRFYDNNGGYLTEYHEDKPDFDSGDPVAVTAGLTTTVNAQLTQAGIISGTVTAEDGGAPLSNADVDVYDAATGDWMGDDDTDGTGVYRIGGLVAGSYKLRFRDYSGVYLAEYHEDKPDLDSADPVAVTAGLTTTVNAALTRGGRITGRVTNASSGAGIAGVSVRAERQDADSSTESATTDANGYYTTTALYTGVYRVSFSPSRPYYSEYYDNFRWGYGFTPVTVTAPLTTTNVDASLRTGYLISGTVTGSGPLNNVSVRAYRGADFYYVASASTGSDGAYQLGPLDPGRYRVRFVPPDLHAGEWYSDSASYAGSTPINLTGDVGNVDADMANGGRITGTVTGAGGVPLAGLWVYVYPAGNGSSIASGVTDANGQYATSPGLTTGAYQVKFPAPVGYTTEWYDNQASQTSATVIEVTAGVTRTNVNAQLAAFANGTITGTLTAADTGLPLSMWVYAYDPDGVSIGSVYASGGTYVLSSLPPDTYRLRFSSPSPYVQIYYDGQPDLDSANPVTVTAGVTTTNINQTIPRGGTITGTVTGPGGVPGVYVYAMRVVGGYTTKSTYTGVDGGYRLEGLKAGGYKVQFSPPPPFIGEWYDGATSQSSAQTISVTLSATTPNIDATLAMGGVITGAITAADTTAPLPGAYVDVYSATGAFVVGSIYADMEGRYQTPGLPAGDYRVYFGIGPWIFYQTEWYDDAPSQSAGLTVTVPASGATPDINAALYRGGSISGWTYSVPKGWLMGSVYVGVYSATTGYYVKYTYSNNGGFYQLNGLSTGPYKVHFSLNGYKQQWYSQTLDYEPALTVTVNAPDDTPDVNAYLLYAHDVYLPLVMRNMP